MTAAVKVPHVHAEVIKAYADGAQIEFRHAPNREWEGVAQPYFDVSTEYRVKPEPPAYPVTRLNHSELADIYFGAFDFRTKQIESIGAVAIANAALRHAIDAKQIITMADHHEEMAKHDEARDMAIAEAVRDACRISARAADAWRTDATISDIDLAAIIAKVAP